MGALQSKGSSQKIYEKVDDFSGGINITDEDNRLKDSELRDLINVKLENNGTPKKRTGHRPIFDFKNCPFFANIFSDNPEKEGYTTITAHAPDEDTTNPEGQPAKLGTNDKELTELTNYARKFLLQGGDSSHIYLKLYYADSENITNAMLNLNYFVNVTSDNSTPLKISDLDKKYFTGLNNLTDETEILASMLNTSAFTNVPKLTEEFDIGYQNFRGLSSDVKGYILFSPPADGMEQRIEVSIEGLQNAFTQAWTGDINTVVKWEWRATTGVSQPNVYPETFEVKKLEPFQKDTISTLHYVVAYHYKRNNVDDWLYFITVSPDENGEYNRYTWCDWYLINDRYYKDTGAYYGKVNQFKFIKNSDNTLTTVDINRTDHYILANIYEQGGDPSVPISFNPRPFVGVDMVQYRANMYIVTGYGMLEVNEDDIINGQFYEAIPFKPSSYDYQNSFSNLLAISRNIWDNSRSSALRSVGTYDYLWNWDWIDYPKTDWITGIISKYPPNSKDQTLLRAVINFSNAQVMNDYVYRWAYISPKGDEEDDGKGYATYTDYIFNAVAQAKDVSIWGITDSSLKTQTSLVANDKSFSTGTQSGGKWTAQTFRWNEDFLENSERVSMKDLVVKYIEGVSGEQGYTGITLDGNMTGNFDNNPGGLDVGRSGGFNVHNIAIRPTVNGVTSPVWINLDGSYSDDSNHYDSYGANHTVKFQVSLKNTGTILNFIKEHAGSNTSVITDDNTYFQFHVEASMWAVDNGAYNTTVKFTLSTNQGDPSLQQLTWKMSYMDVNPQVSASTGLVPIENLERTLSLNYVDTIKECTKIKIVNDQLFVYASRTNANMIWYSDIYNPTYFPITNNINLNRLPNEQVQTIVPFGQNHLIFTKESIYILSGHTREDFKVELGNGNYGIEYPESVVGIANAIIFLGYDGINIIKSTGMDINNVIKISAIDKKIKGLLNLNQVKTAIGTSVGDEYKLALTYVNEENNQILKYNVLKEIWGRDTSLNTLDFIQYSTINGGLYSLTRYGLWNYWYSIEDEKEVLSMTDNTTDEYWNALFKLYSDGYEINPEFGDDVNHNTYYPIEFKMLTKRYSGYADAVHNRKKFKEVQIKHANNDFVTHSNLVWYVNNNVNVTPFFYEYAVDENGEFTAIAGQKENLIINPGTRLARSYYLLDKINPDNELAEIPKLGDNQEENRRIKKGKKGYSQQFEIINKEPLPFGIKSLLLVYKEKKPK